MTRDRDKVAATNCRYRASWNDEKRSKAREYQRTYKRNATQAQRARYLVTAAVRQASMTPEQVAAAAAKKRAADAAYIRKRDSLLTPEQREAAKTVRRQKARERRLVRTPAEIAHRLKYATAYEAKHHRRLREIRREWAHRRMTGPGRESHLSARREKRNNDKERAHARRYDRERKARDPQFRIRKRLAARIVAAFKSQSLRKNTKTFDLLGCTPTDFRAHIESLFKPGMSWERIDDIHIDHIRPISWFDLIDPVQQKACFHYTNLQPLWAEDNRRKSNRWAG